MGWLPASGSLPVTQFSVQLLQASYHGPPLPVPYPAPIHLRNRRLASKGPRHKRLIGAVDLQSTAERSMQLLLLSLKNTKHHRSVSTLPGRGQATTIWHPGRGTPWAKGGGGARPEQTRSSLRQEHMVMTSLCWAGCSLGKARRVQFLRTIPLRLAFVRLKSSSRTGMSLARHRSMVFCRVIPCS